MTKKDAQRIALFFESLDELALKDAIDVLDDEFGISLDEFLEAIRSLERTAGVDNTVQAIVVNANDAMPVGRPPEDYIEGESPLGPEDLDSEGTDRGSMDDD